MATPRKKKVVGGDKRQYFSQDEAQQRQLIVLAHVNILKGLASVKEPDWQKIKDRGEQIVGEATEALADTGEES